MVRLVSAVYLLAGLALAAAHSHPAPSFHKRDALTARDRLEKRCGADLAKRRARRSARALDTAAALAKRDFIGPMRRTDSNDSTCILAPEVTQGPYHILSEIVRQNMTEAQAGVPLTVEADFIDIETCQPARVWVDAWHANATGFYAGYVNETGGGAAGFPVPSTTLDTATLAPTSGADVPFNGTYLNVTTTDNSTFLRAVWHTDEDGHLTMYSVVPGWYPTRSVHFHIKVYPSGSIAPNGTFVPSSGEVHTGQFFFDQSTMDAVAATPAYAANLLPWANATKNEEDQWYPYQNSVGYNADMDITWVGDSIEDGVIGSIAVGLNMSYSSVELSTQHAQFNVTEYIEEGYDPHAWEL